MALTSTDLRRAAQLSLYRKSYETFAVEQLKIKPKLPGHPLIPLRFNLAQQRLEYIAQAQLAKTGKLRMVVLKYRQPGSSTYTMGRGFQLAALNPNISSVVVAHDDETSAHIFGIAKLFYESMSNGVRPMSRYHSKTELVFENPDTRTRSRWPGLRSRITFMTAKNAMSGTGHTVHSAQLSEASKYGPTAKELWNSFKPSVPDLPGTMIVIESTAHFAGQWFRDFYWREKAAKEEYATVFLPWTLSEEYQAALEPGEMLTLDAEEEDLYRRYALTDQQFKWRRNRIRELGGDEVAKKLFQQEYPLEDTDAFIELNMGAFDPRALTELSHGLCPPRRVAEITAGPTIIDTIGGRLSVWEEPLPDEIYDVGVDVGHGVSSGDWSIIQVIKRRNREQVAEWRGKITPIDLAEPAYWLGAWYHYAQMGPETSGPGMATAERLKQLQYPNLFTWRRYGTAVPQLTKQLGWQTSYQSKQYLVLKGRHYIAHRDCIVRSQALYKELREFAVRQTEQREFYEGSGEHDDLVMAWLIALTIGVEEEALSGPKAPKEPSRSVLHVEPGLIDSFRGPLSQDSMTQLAETLKGWE